MARALATPRGVPGGGAANASTHRGIDSKCAARIEVRGRAAECCRQDAVSQAPASVQLMDTFVGTTQRLKCNLLILNIYVVFFGGGPSLERTILRQCSRRVPCLTGKIQGIARRFRPGLGLDEAEKASRRQRVRHHESV